MGQPSYAAAARIIDAEYQEFKRQSGTPKENFVSPFTQRTETNKVPISVKALNDLNNALRASDTLKAMKRQQKDRA